MRVKKWAFWLIALMMIISLTGCGGSDDASSSEPDESSEEEISEYPVTVEGTTVQSRPGRVVSLSPALTEKLYDIHLEERLVGVSNYCDYPTAARNLPQCGTANLPDMDEIRRLEPHLLLTQSQLAEEDLIALQQMNVDVVMIPRAASVAQFKESYIALATLFEGQYTGADMGRDFVRNIQDRLDYLEGYLIPYAEDNGVKDALFLRLLDFNVATGDTLENELMTLIGLNNIAAGETDWLYDGEKANGTGRADFEAIDVIYMDEDFVNIKMLEQSAFYKGLQATLKDWYLYIDSIAFERQGLRMLDELEKMAAYAYPDVVPPLPGAAADPQTDDGGEDETDGSEDDTE